MSEKRVDLKVGFACNNNCMFCAQADRREWGNKTTSQIKKELMEAKKSGCMEVVFTGGEPTIREDIYELVSFSRELGYKTIQLQTNGRRFFYKDFCRQMIEAGANDFSISIHGHIPEIHDKLTRSPGSWIQTVTGIKNLKESGQYVSTNTVVTKQNYKHLPKMAEFLVGLKVDQFQFAFVHPMGNAEKNYDLIVPRISLASEYIKTGLQTGIDAGIEAMAEAMPFCLMKGYENCISELHIPPTEIKDAGYTVPDFGSVRKNEGKVKFKQCRLCKHDSLCEGPWREYPERMGSEEFKPVRDLPEEVKIELTRECNLDCDFCFNKNFPYQGKELNTKQIFKIIDNISESGTEAVRFTGGEPFLRKDLPDIVSYAKSKGLYTILNTNGTLINKKNEKVLNQIDDILISLHDDKEFEEKSKLFKKLKEFNLFLRACTILTKKNIKNLEKFYGFVENQGIDDWFLLRPIPNPENLEPIDSNDIKELVEKILSLNKKHKAKTHIANALPFCSYEPEKISKICIGGRNDDGHTRIVIDSQGNIKPSYFINEKLGNALNDSVLDCWNHDFMLKMRNLEFVPDKCKPCEYLQCCKGGLRFAAKLIKGSYSNPDPLALMP